MVERQNNITASAGGTQGPEVNKAYVNVEAIEFLLKLRPPPWILFTIASDGQFTTGVAHSIAEADIWVTRNKPTHNLYFQLNPTRPIRKKPEKDDITAVEFFHTDLDPVGNEAPDIAKARYLKLFDSGEAPVPTFLIDTGNGLQALWRRAVAPPLGEGPERNAAIAVAEARNWRLVLHLGCDDASTRNIDRILRLPGTTNFPNKAKLAKGRVQCPAKLLAFNDVNHPDEAFPLWAPEEMGPGSPEDGGHHARQEDDAHEGSRLERIIRNGESGEWGGDRSKAVFWVACEMVRMGCEDSMIESTLLDPANGISAHVREQHNPTPRAYAQRQVRDARRLNPQAAPTDELPQGPLVRRLGKGLPKPVAFTVEALIHEVGTGLISGKYFCGKTSVAKSLAASAATGFPFAGRKVLRRGAVLWLAAEGEWEADKRMRAAIRALGCNPDECPVYIQTCNVPKMLAKGGEANLMKIIREAEQMAKDQFGLPLVLIVIDTMIKAAGYKKSENDSVDVNNAIMVAERWSRAIKCFTLFLDHMGWEERHTRGSSDKPSSVDVYAEIKTNGNSIRTLKVEKVKGEKGHEQIDFEIVGVRLEDGQGTAIVHWAEKWIDQGAQAGVPLNPIAQLLQDCVRTVIAHKGVQRIVMVYEPERRCVQKKDIYVEFCRKHKGGRHDMAFKRSWDELIKKCLVSTVSDEKSKGDMDRWVYLEQE
ncbi:AAA domain-containing protein [Rhizobiales bacterium GAS191]|nr:AAA domain-containing protein [Rhizobiales bacterium GAS191]